VSLLPSAVDHWWSAWPGLQSPLSHCLTYCLCVYVRLINLLSIHLLVSRYIGMTWVVLGYWRQQAQAYTRKSSILRVAISRQTGHGLYSQYLALHVSVATSICPCADYVSVCLDVEFIYLYDCLSIWMSACVIVYESVWFSQYVCLHIASMLSVQSLTSGCLNISLWPASLMISQLLLYVYGYHVWTMCKSVSMSVNVPLSRPMCFLIFLCLNTVTYVYIHMYIHIYVHVYTYKDVSLRWESKHPSIHTYIYIYIYIIYIYNLYICRYTGIVSLPRDL